MAFACSDHVERFREGILLDVSVLPGPDKVVGEAVGCQRVAASGGRFRSRWGSSRTIWARLQLLLEGDLDEEMHCSCVWWRITFQLPCQFL